MNESSSFELASSHCCIAASSQNSTMRKQRRFLPVLIFVLLSVWMAVNAYRIAFFFPTELSSSSSIKTSANPLFFFESSASQQQRQHRPEHTPNTATAVSTGSINSKSLNRKPAIQTAPVASPSSTTASITTDHRVAGLVCPDIDTIPGHVLDKKRLQDAIQEIVYWKDIPHDSHMVSPYISSSSSSSSSTASFCKHENTTLTHEEKFLTFEPDEGGWNNLRMAMETTVAMALIMGRTLVLPPRAQFAHLHEKKKATAAAHHHQQQQQQGNVFGFDDFFHFESLQNELAGLKIISFQEFLEQHGDRVLRDPQTGKPARPPDGRTNWDGMIASWDSSKRGESGRLWNWFRSVVQPLDWQYQQCVAVFPQPSKKHTPTNATTGTQDCSSNDNNTETGWISTTPADEDRVRGYLQQILQRDAARIKDNNKNNRAQPWRIRVESYNGNPTPVNASSMERIEEMLADRKELCVYDRTLQEAPVLHAMGEQAKTRFLVHFYAFLHLEDYHHDLWIKRFARDHLRYTDVIQCAAARIVAALHQTAYDPHNNPKGEYHTLHIRRGDFHIAYKDVLANATTIYENTKSMISDNSTVYVATDEKDRAFFAPLAKHYQLVFLSDFGHLVSNVNPNLYGMVDQIVASTGVTFVGTYYSTFSGYINRLRGYRAQNRKDRGYQVGAIDSYYYASHNGFNSIRNIMRNYRSVRQAFWPNEFPVCWRDLDHDVNDDDDNAAVDK